jgi:hypothetical protein
MSSRMVTISVRIPAISTRMAANSWRVPPLLGREEFERDRFCHHLSRLVGDEVALDGRGLDRFLQFLEGADLDLPHPFA